MFFGPGTTHGAYIAIRDIFQQAESSIIVVDGYADGAVLKLAAANTSSDLKLQILGRSFPPDFELECKTFLHQYSHLSLEIKSTSDFHDRFVVIDDDVCHVLGASIKDAGKRAFFTTAIQDAANKKALREQIGLSWNRADPYFP